MKKYNNFRRKSSKTWIESHAEATKYGLYASTDKPLIGIQIFKFMFHNVIQIYDSYRKFQPNKFPENSPQWNMAMIQYLLDMKKNGHKIKEIETTKVLYKKYSI